MDPDRWQRIGELFARLIAVDDPSRRRDLLEKLCADDATLRPELEPLLNAHERATTFLENSVQAEAEAVLADRFRERMIGRRLGPWTIEAALSEGGMGSVFRVRRDGDGFTQVGALKLIRSGLASEQLIRRFEHERRLLARLQHPNIARLVDGGATEDNLPWLVMELVEGQSIDRWCDAHKLSVDARLALFDQVCRAVHFAHQNLVIHRDLKPGNILVGASGEVKLLDFGIAKLLEDSGDSELTLTQQRLLTPASASPEQFLGRPVTTASDVYALGLLLYRLLCGQPAYDVDTATAPADAQRLICRDMPTRPSLAVRDAHRLRTVATARDTGPERLRRQLRGDLDTIVLKALRKEPERRYGSVEELAEDLRRYRAGLPVRARPDSLRYRAGKFVGRHWIGLAATAGAFLALAIGLGAALWQTEQARAERDRVLRINQFLQTILVEADPYEAGAEATVRDVLRKAGEMVGERFGDQPDLEAPLRHTIGYTQLSLMALDESQANLERADELNRRLFGTDDDRTLITQAYLAWIDYRRGHHAEAEAGYRSVLERLNDTHDFATRATIHNDFGIILGELERWEEALAQQQLALELWLEHDPDRREVGIAYNNIAYNLHGLERLEEARAWYERSLERQRREAPDGMSVDLAFNLNNFGVLLRDLGQVEAALPYYRESLSMRQATLGPDHAFTGFGHLNLGRLLLDLDQADEALGELEAAVRISEDTLAPEQLQMLVARASLARARALAGLADPRDELAEVLAAMRASEAPNQFIEQARIWLDEAARGGQP
ncbi:MAG: serine/threonine protein kinase [Wenzhouxiangella sp.]|nr:MAG: serine/threonine protein kinase [Wenzhouxiangella sp.]